MLISKRNHIIKAFTELTPGEEQTFLQFIVDFGFSKLKTKDKNFFKSEIFGGGEDYFILFSHDKIFAAAGVILKELSRGHGYITGVCLADPRLKCLDVLCHGLNSRLRVENKPIWKIGLSPEHKLAPIELERIGLKFINRVIEMELVIDKELETSEEEYSLIELSEADFDKYINIHNQAFAVTPNSGTLMLNELRESFARANSLLGFMVKNDQKIGVYNLSLEEDCGVIESLGLLPEYFGIGAGKNLLKLCINKLFFKGKQKIRLGVADNNQTAYNLYIKTGFETSKVFSAWYQIV
jgi:ribosomal protein S18 acetylase RimI-like enzyme